MIGSGVLVGCGLIYRKTLTALEMFLFALFWPVSIGVVITKVIDHFDHLEERRENKWKS